MSKILEIETFELKIHSLFPHFCLILIPCVKNVESRLVRLKFSELRHAKFAGQTYILA